MQSPNSCVRVLTQEAKKSGETIYIRFICVCKKLKKNIDCTHHNTQHMVYGKERATKIAFYLLTLKQIANNKVRYERTFCRKWFFIQFRRDLKMLLRLPPGLETNPKINEEMEKEEREKESDQIRTYRWFNQRHAKREGRKRNSYRRNGVDQYMQR